MPRLRFISLSVVRYDWRCGVATERKPVPINTGKAPNAIPYTITFWAASLVQFGDGNGKAVGGVCDGITLPSVRSREGLEVSRSSSHDPR